MSVIAVSGIPPMWSLKQTVKVLAKVIKGPFEALNFHATKAKKTCYLRLSERLDPVRVLEKINTWNFGKIRLNAYIPEHVPDIPLAAKPHKVPLKVRRELKIPEDHTPSQIMSITHKEIMTELQAKYPGLYNLSKKTGHKLLKEIGRKMVKRLKDIMDRGGDAAASCYNLSKFYRRTHPHFGDFQLVLSTLHGVQDAAGQPRDQITETELAAGSVNPYTIDNLPFDKVQQACNKYSERINKKVSEHVNSLKTEICDTDTEEEVARKKVREELKKMSPFLSLIVKQVITKHFVPEKTPFHRIRIYGEPFLPNKELLMPLVRRHRGVQVVRSSRMYNMFRFSIPPGQYEALRAMDGTVINGAKLVIRSSDIPLYQVSPELSAEIYAAFGDAVRIPDRPMEEEEEEAEAEEDWEEAEGVELLV